MKKKVSTPRKKSSKITRDIAALLGIRKGTQNLYITKR